MSQSTCPELELLLAEAAEGSGESLEHARACPACAAILEEHRQLEKDLFRLADPLPPPDLLRQVMTRIENAPAPAPASAEIKTGLGILVLSLALWVGTFVARGGGLAELGTTLALVLVRLRSVLLGLASALEVVWRNAAVPLTAALAVVMLLSLFGLRRLAGAPTLSDN